MKYPQEKKWDHIVFTVNILRSGSEKTHFAVEEESEKEELGEDEDDKDEDFSEYTRVRLHVSDDTVVTGIYLAQLKYDDHGRAAAPSPSPLPRKTVRYALTGTVRAFLIAIGPYTTVGYGRGRAGAKAISWGLT